VHIKFTTLKQIQTCIPRKAQKTGTCSYGAPAGMVKLVLVHALTMQVRAEIDGSTA
jgi:hypothetical protein